MNRAFDPSRTSLVTRVLWRIESGLARSPSLSDLAAAESVSPFHLTRAFGLVTGQPIMAYVRARRLTEAAKRLHGSRDNVLTVALDAGYESHEGFARAFREMFGCSPSRARASLPSPMQEPIVMEPRAVPAPVPRIVDVPQRRIVGRSRRYTMEDRARIPAQWEATAAELGDAMYGETYGVCYGFDNGSFAYLVGFRDDGRIDTEGLDHVSVGPGRYAVFAHEGHISSITETWGAIFDHWMPNTDHKAGEGPEFELYAADFDASKPGGVSIWIPIA